MVVGKQAFMNYPLVKLSLVFVQNEQVASAILEEVGGNEYSKEKGARHFRICKMCLLLYTDDEEEEEDVAHAEDENGNVWVRNTIGVQMIEEYETDGCPCKNKDSN